MAGLLNLTSTTHWTPFDGHVVRRRCTGAYHERCHTYDSRYQQHSYLPDLVNHFPLSNHSLASLIQTFKSTRSKPGTATTIRKALEKKGW